MARASVSLSLEEGRWLLHLPSKPGGGGGGGTSAPSVKLLRQKPPVPADGIEFTELDLPEDGNGAVLPGIDSHGNLIPWFGDGGAEAPASEEEQHSALSSAEPGAAEVGPAAVGAGSGAGAAAAAAAHRSAAQTDDTRQSQAAALNATRVAVAAQAAAAVEAAIADALAAPPRKRLRCIRASIGSLAALQKRVASKIWSHSFRAWPRRI